MMGRHFSESEVSAMSRNRIEDKGLRQRLFRLHEEKTMTYDNYAKERKLVMDNLKENRRTSGNIQIEIDDTDIPEEIFKNILLSRRPWSCTPKETTFNVIYRDSSDPGLIRATYLLKDKGKRAISRRASAKSVPNGSRSHAVSRQSIRSEPVLTNSRREINSRFSNRSRASLNSQSLKVGGYDKAISYNNYQHKSNLSKDGRHSRVITAAWTNEGIPGKATSNKNDQIDSPVDNKQDSVYAPDNDDAGLNNITDKSDSTNVPINDEACITIAPITDISDSIFVTVKDRNENDAAKPTQEDIGYAVLVSSRDPKEQARKLQTKNKIRKRLSIKEPSFTKLSENDIAITKIYDLTKKENDTYNLVAESIPFEEVLSKNNDSSVVTQEPVQEPTLSNTEQETHLENTPNMQDGQGPKTTDKEVQESNRTITMERQTSSSVVFDVVEFTSIHDPDEEKNCIYYKGKAIHNYVKPQMRYKYDPFAARSRERLIRKLTTDVPVFLKDEKSHQSKLHRVFSKGARKRMLKQLIEENNSPNKGKGFNIDQDQLENKIQEFHKSISEFCRLHSFSS